MNYALAIYESGLQYLLEQLGKGHPTYSKALLLQTRLQENITRSQHADTSTQRADRERIVAELNDLTRQVLDISFVELCL